MEETENGAWEVEGAVWTAEPPRTDDALMNYHYEVSNNLRAKVVLFFDAITAMFGVETAEAMALAFLEKTHNLIAAEKLRELGWREYLDDPNWTDWIDLSVRFRECAAYGIDGAAPREHEGTPREERVKELCAIATRMLDTAILFLPADAAWALHFALARFAYDFGGTFTLRALQLLAQIGYPAVRNAAAAGELVMSGNGTVDHEQGVRWLSRRRDFLPSRWRNPEDDQQPIAVGRPESAKMVQVPQCEDGPFLPKTVIRGSRKTGGIHVTIGAKGKEESVHDFFEALRKLARMPTPRWRRRNAAGNWGIVRARGAWVSVPTELIRKQLDELASQS